MHITVCHYSASGQHCCFYITTGAVQVACMAHFRRVPFSNLATAVMSCSNKQDMQEALAQLPADHLPSLAKAGMSTSSLQVLLLIPAWHFALIELCQDHSLSCIARKTFDACIRQ